MTRKPLFIASLFVVFLLRVSAGTLDDKTPAYFVDRYGPATDSKTVSSEVFHAPKVGMVTVKGQFSVRSFRKGDLRVDAIFLLPSLQLAGVRLHLKNTWTPAQIDAALAAYGDEWKKVKNGVVVIWEAPDGSTATLSLLTLHIQSKTMVDAVAKVIADDAAKRKAVPKF